MDAVPEILSHRGRPDRIAEQKEDLARALDALGRLPEAYREVVILREVEEREYAEIADILGISIGTVESRLFRAREKLKRFLTDEVSEHGSKPE